MWLYGLIFFTFLAMAKCSETEITIEAAFQGRCGHGSPCEQLCYELHDGMYECDCTDGFELQKNGYSCQVINSTFQQENDEQLDRQLDDEDILYQKGASFSAKLDDSNIENIETNILFNSQNSINNKNSNNKNSSSNHNIMTIEKLWRNKNNNKNKKNNQDIDVATTHDADDDEDLDDVDYNEKEYEYYKQTSKRIFQAKLLKPPSTVKTPVATSVAPLKLSPVPTKSPAMSRAAKILPRTISTTQIAPVVATQISATQPITVLPTNKLLNLYNVVAATGADDDDATADDEGDDDDDDDENGNNGEENVDDDEDDNDDSDYSNQNGDSNIYSKEEDMSVYDDVNNNKLNLNNNLNDNYYQNHVITKKSKIKNRNRYRNLDTISSSNSNSKINKISGSSSSSNGNDFNENYLQTTTSSTTPRVAVGTVTVGMEDVMDSDNTTATVQQSKQQNDIVVIIMDGTTERSEIIPSRCPLDCGMDGVCDFNDGSGMSGSTVSRCLCPFGKSGIKCANDQQINVPRFSKKSWIAFPALRGAYKHVQLHIEFRPEAYDGIILLTGERDDLTGDFMALLIHQGFIEFWFDCGSGTGKVRSQETVILNQWNTVTVYRHRWDAWLVLNKGNRVQGRSQGLFSRITFREPIFLGGTGNITGLAKKLPIYDGLVGCIRKFIANDHDYRFSFQPHGDVTQGFDVQECTTDRCSHYPCRHGGKCIPSDQGAICLCPLGFGGDLCEMRLDLQVPSFNGSSYLRFAPLGDKSLIWLELKIILKPLQEDGLLLYSGHYEYGDYISLCLNMGYVEFTFELGSGPATVRSEFPLTMGQWHTIRVSRTARLAVIKIDQLPEIMTISPNGFWHLSLPHSLFLGGVHNLQILPLSLREKGSFVGCIQRVDVNEKPLNIISEALGGSNVDNCPHACIARPCGPLARCIPNLESYECQCNPIDNFECIKYKQMTQTSTPSTTISTSTVTTQQSTVDESGYDDNDDDDETNNDDGENYYDEYDKTTTLKSSTLPSSTSTSTSTSTTTSTTSTSTTTTTTPSPPPSTTTVSDNYNDIKSNDDYLKDDYYYYEYDEDDNAYKNANDNMNDDEDNGHIIINPNNQKHHLSLTLSEIVKTGPLKMPSFDETTTNKPMLSNHKFTRPTTMSATISTLPIESTTPQSTTTTDSYRNLYSENVKQKLDVTRVNGRYMSVDNDQLLKYDKIRLNEKLQKHTQNQHEQIKYYTEKEFIKKMNKFLKNEKFYTAEERNDRSSGGGSGSGSGVAPGNPTNPNSRSNFDLRSARPHNNSLRKDHGACFTGTDSYLHFNDAETMRCIISYQIDLNLRFKTHSLNGLILWTGRHTALEDDDYLSLGIENGYLHLRYNLGSGEVNIKYNSTKVSDGLWHRIRAYRNLQEGSLEVDGGRSIVQRSPGKLRQLNTDTGLYVGGMSNARYYTRRRYQSGINGCISEIILAGELRLNMDGTTIGTAHNVEPGVP